jgi:hypothetical protein
MMRPLLDRHNVANSTDMNDGPTLTGKIYNELELIAINQMIGATMEIFLSDLI